MSLRQSRLSSTRSRRPLGLWLGAVLLGSACGTSPAEPVVASDSLTATRSCHDAAEQRSIDGEVWVRVLLGAGVLSDTVDEILGDIQAFYEPHRLRFGVTRTASIDDQAILGGTLAEIETRLRASGTSSTTDEGRRIILETALQPVSQFLHRHAVPPRRQLDLVILTRVADDTSVASTLLGDIAGLGLAPNGSPLSGGALPRWFTPTVFVGAETLAGFDPEQAALVAAHEVAHALGLGHDSREWNLMNPDSTDCLPGLSPVQAATIAESPAVRSTR